MEWNGFTVIVGCGMYFFYFTTLVFKLYIGNIVFKPVGIKLCCSSFLFLFLLNKITFFQIDLKYCLEIAEISIRTYFFAKKTDKCTQIQDFNKTSIIIIIPHSISLEKTLITINVIIFRFLSKFEDRF